MVVVVTLQNIIDKTEAVISGLASREEVANWASNMLQLHEENALEFSPISTRDKVMRSIIYLTGIDLRVSPDTYLHDVLDIVEFKENKLLQ